MERINRVPKELGMKLLLLKAFCQLSVRKMVGLVSQKKCWCWAQGKLEEVKRRTRVCCIPRLWQPEKRERGPWSACFFFSQCTSPHLEPFFLFALPSGQLCARGWNRVSGSGFVSLLWPLFRTSHSSHTCCYRAVAETSPYKNTSATILESR